MNEYHQIYTFPLCEFTIHNLHQLDEYIFRNRRIYEARAHSILVLRLNSTLNCVIHNTSYVGDGETQIERECVQKVVGKVLNRNIFIRNNNNPVTNFRTAKLTAM